MAGTNWEACRIYAGHRARSIWIAVGRRRTRKRRIDRNRPRICGGLMLCIECLSLIPYYDAVYEEGEPG
jgi:hypothetical protein